MNFTKRLRNILAGTAAVATATVAFAAPSHAVTFYTAATYATNNAIGISSGTVSYTPSIGSMSIGAYLTDKRDGYYVTLQVRPLVRFDSTGLSQWGAWRRVGTTANETMPGSYVSTYFYTARGTTFTDAEVRLCQTNAAGSVLGRCTVTVPIDGWGSYYA